MLNRVLIFCFIIVLTGCAASRSVNSAKKDHLEFTYKMTVHSEKSMHVNGKIIIDSDFSYCQGYSKAMGIELFRIKTTTDSLFYIDKYSKSYYQGNREVDSINNETFTLISNIDIILRSWQVFSHNDTTLLENSDDVVSYSTSEINKVKILDIDLIDKKLSISYNHINRKHNFPEIIDLIVKEKGKMLKVTFLVDDFLKYNTVKPIIKIPKKYKPIV